MAPLAESIQFLCSSSQLSTCSDCPSADSTQHSTQHSTPHSTPHSTQHSTQHSTPHSTQYSTAHSTKQHSTQQHSSTSDQHTAHPTNTTASVHEPSKLLSTTQKSRCAACPPTGCSIDTNRTHGGADATLNVLEGKVAKPLW